jgi:hypothetical protein
MNLSDAIVVWRLGLVNHSVSPWRLLSPALSSAAAAAEEREKTIL